MRSTTWGRGHWGTFHASAHCTHRFHVGRLRLGKTCANPERSGCCRVANAPRLGGMRSPLPGQIPQACDAPNKVPDRGRRQTQNAAIERSTGSPHRDIALDAKQSAQALLAAERFDKGEISEAEYKLELATTNVEAETHRLQRENNAAAVAAQQQAAAAASQAAIQSAIPRTTHTNCNTFGGTVNCTTY